MTRALPKIQNYAIVFHIGASQNETLLRPSAPPRCIRARLSTLPVADFSASSNVKCLRRDRLCDTRALVLLVVVSHVSELLSVRIRPREPDDARLPVFRHGDRARHHHLAGFR